MPLPASEERASSTTARSSPVSTMPHLRFGVPVTVAAFCAFFALARAAPTPAPNEPHTAADPVVSTSSTTDDVLYDQRQNGTENVRIHMNDVTVVVAPSDGLLQLLSAGSSSDLLNFGASLSTNSHQLTTSEFSTNIAGAGEGKPGFDCDAVGKCRHAQQPAPGKRNRFRLSNILMPLFNRAQHISN
nr:PREDICTED: uncharacterized protein LOC109042084 [Bemisia tabaci]